MRVGSGSTQLRDGRLPWPPADLLSPAARSLQGRQIVDDDVDRAFAALEPAAGAEERGAADELPAAVEDGGRDDEVDRAALVLEQEEGDAVGGLGTLARGDHAGDFDGR